MLIDRVIWYVFIYAVIGYLVEVLYCSALEKRLVNRGFLSGPWLPIYGIGAQVILLATASLDAHPPLVFLVTVLCTSVLEYLGSWALELLFGLQLWDYSSRRFNIRGRVCLKNSTLFGLLGLLLVYAIHPTLSRFVDGMGERTVVVGAHLMVSAIAVDTTVSSLRLVSFTALLERYHRRKAEIEGRIAAVELSEYGKLLIEHLRQERAQLHEALVARSRSIIGRFPTLTSHNAERKGHLRSLKMRMGRPAGEDDDGR